MIGALARRRSAAQIAERQPRLDDDADLAAVPLLALGDARFDASERVLAQHAARVVLVDQTVLEQANEPVRHHHRSRRAAAVEVAAAAGAEPAAAAPESSAEPAAAEAAAPPPQITGPPKPPRRPPPPKPITPTRKSATMPAPIGEKQARGQPPAGRADSRAGGERAELAPHDAAEQPADDRHADEEEDRQVLPVEAAQRGRAPRRRVGRRRRQLLAGDERGDAVDRRIQAAGEVVVAKRRDRLLADDPAGDDVGDRALQRRGDLDVTSWSFFATTMTRPSPTSLRPIFQVAATRCANEKMSSGRAVGTIRMTICVPRSRSIAASLALSAAACAARERRRLVDDAAGEDRHRNDVLGLCAAEDERNEKAAAARSARIPTLAGAARLRPVNASVHRS